MITAPASNKCIFCFIDQMPPGMRETLYFKDDDSRLSFLQGNYVTLTNMKEHDIDRIIRYHAGVPSTFPSRRRIRSCAVEMLHNRFAGRSAEKRWTGFMRPAYEMNGQIVLCKGVNDGEELDHTIRRSDKVYSGI